MGKLRNLAIKLHLKKDDDIIRKGDWWIYDKDGITKRKVKRNAN